MEKKLKNRSDKTCWEKFHDHTSEQYDQNVSYRFLYKLRNYIQHHSPPIYILYNSYLEKEQPVIQITMYCSKEELLQDKEMKKIKSDILLMDDVIDILPHVDSMMMSLNQILVKHLQDEFLYLRKSAMCIHNLLQKIPRGQDRGVYEIHFVKKNIVGMTPHLMYSDIVEAIFENDVHRLLQLYK
jgi:hypothetical protein